MKMQTKNVSDIVEEYFCTIYKINRALSGNVFNMAWFGKLERGEYCSSNYRELPYPNGDFIVNLFYINPEEFNATPCISREDLIRRLDLILPPYPIREPYVILNSGDCNRIDEHFLMLFEKNRLINNLVKKYKSISREIEFTEEGRKESSKPIDRERYIKIFTAESKRLISCSDEQHKRNATYQWDMLQEEGFRKCNDLENKLNELKNIRKNVKNDLSPFFFNQADIEFSKLCSENRIILKYLIDLKNIDEIKKFLEKANINIG